MPVTKPQRTDPGTEHASLAEAELAYRREHADELVEEVMRLRARAAAEIYVRLQMREIAEVVKAWDVCDRPACRRAGACRAKDVACFDEHADELRMRMEELAEWPRFDGPFDDEALDDIANDMRARGAPI
jgi:hypothetical protein